MSAPTSPDDAAVGPPERLHPLFLLSGLTGSLRSMAGAYALIAWLAVSKSLWLALLAAGGLLAFGLIGVALYWTRFEFRIGSDEIRIDQGIVSRSHRSIPFDRIHDVDISQGPLQRLLGLAKVTFETGGGSGAGGADDGALQAITLERAEQIRALVRSQGTPSAAAPGDATNQAEADDGTPVYAMTVPRLLLAGTFNFSLAVLAALLGLSQTVGDAVGFDPLSESFWRNLLGAVDPLARYAEQHRGVAIAGGALLLVLVGLVTGMVRTFVREFGFRLDRTDVGLRRRRGLFTRTDVTLPVKRAQAVVVATGPVRDGFGWRELKLQSLARDEDGKGDHVLAPLATEAELDAIVSQLGWAPVPLQPAWSRVSKAYIWTRAIALSPFLLIIGLNLFAFAAAPLLVDETVRSSVAAMVLPAVLVVAVPFALLMFAVAARWLAWLRTGYLIDGDRLLIRRGWWRRTMTVLPVSKIQSIDLSESFVSRWFGTANLTVGVAGGGIRGHSIPAIPREAARHLRDELLNSAA